MEKQLAEAIVATFHHKWHVPHLAEGSKYTKKGCKTLQYVKQLQYAKRYRNECKNTYKNMCKIFFFETWYCNNFLKNVAMQTSLGAAFRAKPNLSSVEAFQRSPSSDRLFIKFWVNSISFLFIDFLAAITILLLVFSGFLMELFWKDFLLTDWGLPFAERKFPIAFNSVVS